MSASKDQGYASTIERLKSELSIYDERLPMISDRHADGWVLTRDSNFTGVIAETTDDRRPFITSFATLIAPSTHQKVRYDVQRQLSEVFVAGAWVDAATLSPTLGGGTRCTKVENETTDDD